MKQKDIARLARIAAMKRDIAAGRIGQATAALADIAARKAQVSHLANPAPGLGDIAPEEFAMLARLSRWEAEVATKLDAEAAAIRASLPALRQSLARARGTVDAVDAVAERLARASLQAAMRQQEQEAATSSSASPPPRRDGSPEQR
ncbi:hypothetical protein [Oceanibium sediminis]|uniref:hypothetical protein n=1 Tax=Oceanibium sediminis TaxID=2026339 RepID=UPI000DD33049|nr:hypothetical protein [Oceanibium sediminis]